MVTQLLTCNSLGQDHVNAQDGEIIAEVISSGPGAPTTPPVEPDKIWLWVDTTSGTVSHYWDPASQSWIALTGVAPALNVVRKKIPGDFATGAQIGTTTIQARNCVIGQTALGQYTVKFSSPHPDGDRYEVVYGVEESSATRDVPKASTVAGSRTANGFQIQVTVDDNGAAADPYTGKHFAFAVKTTIVIVEDVSYA